VGDAELPACVMRALEFQTKSAFTRATGLQRDIVTDSSAGGAQLCAQIAFGSIPVEQAPFRT
jgi:hypothetical protein